MIKALSSSLSLRLLGIFFVTAALLIYLLISLFSRGLNVQWGSTIRPHLSQYIQYIQEDLGSPPSIERADAIAKNIPVDIYIYQQGNLIHATNGGSLDISSMTFEPVSRRHPRHKHATQNLTPNHSAQKMSITLRGSGQRVLRIIDGEHAIYYDLREPRRAGGKHFNDELLRALAALAVVLAGSYLLIRQQLRPIGHIQKGVGEMSEGNLNHRIAKTGRSDLDKLANSIDAMAARIQAMLDAKRQLLMAVSHELRSPITRARINTELLPESHLRTRLQEDLYDMERMIRDIMESEQLQSRHTVLNQDDLNLAELFQSELAHVAPDTPLILKPPHASMQLRGDAARLRILLRNLVLNAQQHGKSEDGTVHLQVTLCSSHKHVTLKLSDKGPGIDPQHVNEVSAPFYRPDASRSRETGGFGLGLTLARLIAEAHGGALHIDSHPANEPGTHITVELPIER